ncbi:MAG TPA: hypothetical protein VK958_00800 [Methylophilus sp.]|uniref:hypothetical protein n=1 Tax=Methylophilus sp. TaxID=29541 RepID=UPI002D14F097|nr:hypothetical protein [Methylophilus sp.]HSH85767.1 hypothetical protein [Methylophilus sp.]
MASKLMIFAVGLSFTLSGCSTFQRLTDTESPTWPWKGDGIKGACPNSETTLACSELEALNAYVKAMEFCRLVHNYYENGGTMAKGTKFGIGILGAVSGAVLAPITTGGASTAFASFSGAANGMQTSFEENFSSSFNLSKQIAVADEGRNGVSSFNSAITSQLSHNDKVGIAIGIAYKCSVAANKTDSAVITALSNDKAIIEDQKKKNDALSKDLEDEKKLFEQKQAELAKLQKSVQDKLNELNSGNSSATQ